jgi:hypothetical protein
VRGEPLVLFTVVVAAACPPRPVEGCNSDAECSDGNVCISGACQPRGPAVCLEGFHDGGGGRCLPIGECSDGFRRFFVDADRDAHGSATLGDDCAAAESPGFANAPDDCDDDDADRFNVGNFDFDRDGDGRSINERACFGDSPPAGALDEPLPSSTVMVHPSNVDQAGPGDSWSNVGRVRFSDDNFAEVRVRGGRDTARLVLSGFTCAAPMERMTGIALHMIARAAGVSGANTATTVLTISDGVFFEITAESDATYPTSTTDIVQSFSFPDDILDPCSGALTISILMRGIELDKDLQVDEIYVEAFGVEDCDDDDNSIFMPVNVHLDSDGDGSGGAEENFVCVASRDDVDGDLITRDCDDEDIDAFPGQTQFFTEPRVSGGFDYNCDGNENGPSFDEFGCNTDEFGGCFDSVVATTSRACGETFSVQRCDLGSCSQFSVDVTQACR